MALVTEVQLGILRGELHVPPKITEPGLAARGAFLFLSWGGDPRQIQYKNIGGGGGADLREKS